MIEVSDTPSGNFYCNNKIYEEIKEKIFCRTWQIIGDKETFPENGFLYPIHFMKDCLNEHLLLSKNENGEVKLMSNVCTHRGFVLVERPTKGQNIRCRYHGRCFSNEGKFLFMPEFEEAVNFPTERDNLKQVSVEKWNNFYFASLFPLMPLNDFLKDINARLEWFPFEKLKLIETKEYKVKANWALYCDNYLEGFHIPFVHKQLNKVLDYGNYETILFDYSNLQIGIAKEDEIAFDLPTTSIDYGKKVAAYYYWIFPNLMLNFYPWGISVNIVNPTAVDKTTVTFLTYISDHSKFNQGAGSELESVELEDEEVVESVQRGLNSRLYEAGRYSPKMEKGVFHFHELVSKFIER